MATTTVTNKQKHTDFLGALIKKGVVRSEAAKTASKKFNITYGYARLLAYTAFPVGSKSHLDRAKRRAENKAKTNGSAKPTKVPEALLGKAKVSTLKRNGAPVRAKAPEKSNGAKKPAGFMEKAKADILKGKPAPVVRTVKTEATRAVPAIEYKPSGD
jgi:hypothetical protein